MSVIILTVEFKLEGEHKGTIDPESKSEINVEPKAKIKAKGRGYVLTGSHV